MEDNRKMYKVTWKIGNPDPELEESGYLFVAANTELEAIENMEGTDFSVREASYDEAEAYVAGYEDGYDNAIIADRLNTLDINIDQLTEVDFDRLFPPVEEEDDNNG
jgi:hypothetical protein